MKIRNNIKLWDSSFNGNIVIMVHWQSSRQCIVISRVNEIVGGAIFLCFISFSFQTHSSSLSQESQNHTPTILFTLLFHLLSLSSYFSFYEKSGASKVEKLSSRRQELTEETHVGRHWTVLTQHNKRVPLFTQNFELQGPRYETKQVLVL